MSNFKFGATSKARLAECHPELVRVITRALSVSTQDFSVLCGYRNRTDQESAFRSGNTKVHYPNSAHNQTGPAGHARSCAVDLIPYPFKSWEDREGWRKISIAVFAAASEMHIPIRWGGGIPDKKFAWDLPHFELHPWRNWRYK